MDDHWKDNIKRVDCFQRTAKLTKQQKDQYSLAQRDPAAFFEEIKKRLLAYQAQNSTAAKIRGLSQSLNVQNRTAFNYHDPRTIVDDSSAILESQIAKTIDDADTSLFETPTKINYRYRPSSMSKQSENRNYSFLGNSFTRSDSGVGTDTSEK